MSHYLDAEKVRNQMIAQRQYTSETAPSVSEFQLAIDSLEVYLEAWLGYSPYLQNYQETLSTGRNGTVRLKHYPVKEILSIEPLQTHYSIGSGGSVQSFNQMYPCIPVQTWEDETTLMFSTFEGSLRVSYQAGYDPLPPQFAIAMFGALQKTMQNGSFPGDISFLNEPSKDTQSLSIPSVSKTWRISQPKTQGETQGDRLFSSLLSQYRRHLVF